MHLEIPPEISAEIVLEIRHRSTTSPPKLSYQASAWSYRFIVSLCVNIFFRMGVCNAIVFPLFDSWQLPSAALLLLVAAGVVLQRRRVAWRIAF